VSADGRSATYLFLPPILRARGLSTRLTRNLLYLSTTDQPRSRQAVRYHNGVGAHFPPGESK
jgi:hypothetical protein